MRAPSARAIRTASALLAGVVILYAGQAFTRGTGPDTGPRRIPFKGHVEKDGEAVSGSAVPMKFTLSNGTQSWTYGPVNLNLISGDFTVLLGEPAQPGLPPGQTAIPDWVFSSASVTVAVEVDGVPLSGTQRIVPMPYAYWSAESDNLTVTQDITVHGDVLKPSADGQLAVSRDFAFRDTGTANLSLTTGAGSTTSANLLLNNITLQGTASFGSTTRQMLNLFGTSYGLGVQTSSLYARTDNDFNVYRGGTHVNTRGSPGTGGTALWRVDESRKVWMDLKYVTCGLDSVCPCPAGYLPLSGGITCDGDWVIKQSWPYFNADQTTGWTGSCRNPGGTVGRPDGFRVLCARMGDIDTTD
jgi:hypothetical protein